MESLKFYGTLFLAPNWLAFFHSHISPLNPKIDSPKWSCSSLDNRTFCVVTDSCGPQWPLGYLSTFPPEQARICLDALWQQRNVNAFHSKAFEADHLSLFFFFTQSLLLSPSLLSEYAVKWRACQGAWSVHRCPAVYWGREGKGRGECGGVGVERLDHMNPGKWPSNIQFAAVTFRNPGIHKHYFIQVFFFFFLRYLSYFTIPFKSLLTHVHNSRIN